MKKAIKIAKKIMDIFCWIIIALLIITVVLSVSARMSGTNPTIFGYSIYRVSSGSMEPELSIGDVILGKTVDNPMSINEGDIVTYKGKGSTSGMLITHEVIVAPYTENGKIVLQTKGLANPEPDPLVDADRLVSVMVTELSFLNVFYDVFFSPWGLVIILVLILFVFIDELIVFIKALTGTKSPKEGEDINEIIERLQAEKTENNEVVEKNTEDDVKKEK